MSPVFGSPQIATPTGGTVGRGLWPPERPETTTSAKREVWLR